MIGLNLWLAQQAIADWARGAGSYAPLIWTGCLAVGGALCGLLVWIAVHPYRRPAAATATLGLEERSADLITAPTYRRILVPLDHSPLDRIALSHAAAPRRRAPTAASICCTWKKASPARSTVPNRRRLKSKRAANISTASSTRSAR